MFEKLKKWWQSLRYYVIADPEDNSITLSEKLFDHIHKHNKDDEGDRCNVFVFRIPETGTFAFAVSPELESQTQLCEIQYNGKYKCIGFETLCPSVGRIFYEYGLPHDKRVRLSVSVHRLKSGLIYYQMHKPDGKFIEKYTKA